MRSADCPEHTPALRVSSHLLGSNLVAAAVKCADIWVRFRADWCPRCTIQSNVRRQLRTNVAEPFQFTQRADKVG